MVSDLDVARAAHAGAAEVTAAEMGATEPVTIEPPARWSRRRASWTTTATAHLIVVDRQRPVGIISTFDLASVLAWGRA